MTNIQAIDLLKDLEQSLDDYCELNDEGKTAFRMAIAALELFGISEQLPSVQSEKRTEERTETHACDLIDRQAAVDALHMHLMYRMGTDSNKKRLDDWINGVPSAQPEPKWIPCRESNGNIHPYSELLHERKDILVTYKTRTGRRYVKQVLCNHGRVEKILLGDIVAWLPLPTPYREDKMQTE